MKPAASFGKARIHFKEHTIRDVLIYIPQFGELEHLQKCFSESHQ